MLKKIAANTLLLSGSQILGRAIGFLYFIFLARALGVTDFGVYAWVLGFVYNFYPLADFGLERLVMRDIPRYPQKTNYYLARLMPLRLFLALGTLLVFLLTGFLMGLTLAKLFFVFLFGLSLIPSNLVFIIAMIQNAREKAVAWAKITFAIPLIAAFLGIAIIQLKLPFWLLYTTFGWSTLVCLIWLIIKSPKLSLKIGWIIDLPFWRKLIKDSWLFAVILTLAVFYLRMPLILIGRLLGDYWAGIYGAGSKFVEAGICIPQGFILALFPLSSRLVKSNKARLKKIYFKAWRALFFASLPFALIMIFGASWLIPLIYGVDYKPAVPVFSLMGVLMIFVFVNSLAGNVIHNSKKLKTFLPFAFMNFLVALIVGLFLIPRVGVIGGVWALIAGESFGLIINNWFVFKILKGNNEE